MLRPAPLKARLLPLLQAGALEEIARLAVEERRILGALVPLMYSADEETAWRAVEATGLAVARVGAEDPGAAREHLRRLFWLMTEESGAVCWRAPESMAEIVAQRPDLFADYVPIVAHLLAEMAEEDLAHFGAGILWAIGRLGPLAEPWMAELAPQVARWLPHPDPQLRGTAAWALGRTGAGTVVREHPALLSDAAPVALRLDGATQRTTVGALAVAAVAADSAGE